MTSRRILVGVLAISLTLSFFLIWPPSFMNRASVSLTPGANQGSTTSGKGRRTPLRLIGLLERATIDPVPIVRIPGNLTEMWQDVADRIESSKPLERAHLPFSREAGWGVINLSPPVFGGAHVKTVTSTVRSEGIVDPGDPQIVNRQLNIPPQPWNLIRIEMQVSAEKDSYVQVFWLKGEGNFVDTTAQSTTFVPINDGRFHVYYVPTPTTIDSGISALRIDPIQTPGGQHAEVDIAAIGLYWVDNPDSVRSLHFLKSMTNAGLQNLRMAGARRLVSRAVSLRGSEWEGYPLETRQTIFGVPGDVTFDVSLTEAQKVRFGMAVLPFDGAGAVRFQVLVKRAESAPEVVFSADIDPSKSTHIREGQFETLNNQHWLDAEVDLSGYKGQGQLIFRTRMRKKGPGFHYVAWANPIVIQDPPNPATNVVLVAIDTARADHFSSYGYDASTTPNLDRLAGDGGLFRTCISQSSWSLPSFASLMMSVYPSQHKGGRPMLVDGDARLTPVEPGLMTIAEIMKAHGYLTQGFAFQPYFEKTYGLFPRDYDGFWNGIFGLPNSGDLITKGAQDWLARNADSPFFLFLHYMDLHAVGSPPQYQPHQELRAAFTSSIRAVQTGAGRAATMTAIASYDRNLRYVDQRLGSLFQTLDRLGLSDSTLVIVTGDHGEELGERGKLYNHGTTLYEEQIRVPLIMRLPGVITKQTTVDSLVRTIDISPTILDAAGIAAPAQFEGKSLLPLLKGESIESSRVAVSEYLAVFDHASGMWFEKKSLRTQRYKYIWSTVDGGDELYDVVADPQERSNIAAQFTGLTKTYRTRIQDILARKGSSTVSPARPVKIDPEQERRLRSLGYLR